jgi:hypothetical protein
VRDFTIDGISKPNPVYFLRMTLGNAPYLPYRLTLLYPFSYHFLTDIILFLDLYSAMGK